MRVLWLLAAWSVLAVLATMCFALGGSIGYRRGVRDTVAQLRDRRSGKTGCRPLPANHLRRRTSGYARPGSRARRARWPAPRPAATPARAAPRRLTTATAATVAAVLLIGVPGTAIGATTARPGESLWKVKLGLERVRLAVAAGPERNAEVHVDLATARLSELAGLVGTEATPEVVGEVSDDLGSHARAADHALGDVGTTATRDELQRRLTDVKHKQVVVMDTLLGAECGDDARTDCVALAETRDETVELRDDPTDETVAVAVPVEEDTAEASPPPASVAQADAAATTPANGETIDGDAAAVTAAEAPQPSEPATTASEPPVAGAPTPPPPTADTEPSESPSPSATPTPAPSPSGESAAQTTEAPASEAASPAPTGPIPSPDTLEAQASQD